MRARPPSSRRPRPRDSRSGRPRVTSATTIGRAMAECAAPLQRSWRRRRSATSGHRAILRPAPVRQRSARADRAGRRRRADRSVANADTRLELVHAVNPAGEQPDEIGRQQVGDGVHDRGDDPRPIEVRRRATGSRPARVRSRATGRAARRRALPSGAPPRATGRPSRPARPGPGRSAVRSVPSKLTTREQLVAVDDRRGHLGPDVGPGGEVVGVG